MAGSNDEVTIEIVRAILKYGAFLQRTGDRILRPYDISQQEFAVLSAIARAKKPIYQATLVVDLLVERSNLSKIVKRLEEKGLIQVHPVSGDGRLRRLTCAAAGRKLFRRAELALNRWNRQWLQAFGQSELAALSGFLDRLSAMPNGSSHRGTRAMGTSHALAGFFDRLPAVPR